MKKIISLLLILTFILSTRGLGAQQNEISLSIFPAIAEYSAESEKVIENEISIANNLSIPVPVSLKAKSLIAQGQINQQASLEKYDASSWIEFSETEFIIDSNEVKTVSYKVNVPSEVSPGGHYAQIVVKPLNQTASPNSSVAVTPELVTSILITTPGDVVKEINISEIITNNKLITNTEESIKFIAENTGNVHEIVTPKLEIKQNGQLIKSITSPAQLILPDTKHEFNFKTLVNFDIGEYELVASVSYADSETSLSKSINVQPPLWQLILAVMVGVLVLLLAFKWRKIPLIISILRGETKNIRGSYKFNESNNESKEYKKKDINEVIKSIENERKIIGLPKKYQKNNKPLAKQESKKIVKESVDTDIKKSEKNTLTHKGSVTTTKDDNTKTTIIKNPHTMIIRDEEVKPQIKSEPKKINIKFD